MPPVPQQIFIAIFSVAFVGASGWVLGTGVGTGKGQGKSLYRLWYLFSAVVCITIVAMTLAHVTGTFNNSGEPTGKIGNYILWIFDGYTDLKFELGIFLCAAFVIIAPPSMAYMLGGLFGFANWEILFPKILQFLLYCLIKAFVSFSGIVIIIMPWAYFEGWDKLTLTETFCASFASLSFIGLSFLIMFIYLNRAEIILLLVDKMPLSLWKCAKWVHQLLTRNLK